MQLTCLRAGDSEFQADWGGVRQFTPQRLEDGERLRSPARSPLRGSEDETRRGVRGIDVQDFSRLLHGEIGIPFKEPFRMGNGNVDRAKRL